MPSLYVREITREEHLAHLRLRPDASHLQIPEWGGVKPDWLPESIGWFESDGSEPVAAALVLYRPLPGTRRYLAYLPDGPAIDWRTPGWSAGWIRSSPTWSASGRSRYGSGRPWSYGTGMRPPSRRASPTPTYGICATCPPPVSTATRSTPPSGCGASGGGPATRTTAAVSASGSRATAVTYRSPDARSTIFATPSHRTGNSPCVRPRPPASRSRGSRTTTCPSSTACTPRPPPTTASRPARWTTSGACGEP